MRRPIISESQADLAPQAGLGLVGKAIRQRTSQAAGIGFLLRRWVPITPLANALVLVCAMRACNIPRRIGQTGLLGPDAPPRHPAKRRRLRPVMQEPV